MKRVRYWGPIFIGLRRKNRIRPRDLAPGARDSCIPAPNFSLSAAIWRKLRTVRDVLGGGDIIEAYDNWWRHAPCSSVECHNVLFVQQSLVWVVVKLVFLVAHFWCCLFFTAWWVLIFLKLFAFIYISVCRDSLVCLLAGPVINGEKLVLEPIYIWTSGSVRSSPGV